MLKSKNGSWVLVTILICISIYSSCSKKVFIPVEKETVRTEVIRDTIVSYVLDKEYVYNVADTISLIETNYAVSKAFFDGGIGKLQHSIWNKDTVLPLKVSIKEVLVEKNVPAPYPVEVEKPVPTPTRMPLRWWESALIFIGIVTIFFIAFRLSMLFIKR